MDKKTFLSITAVLFLIIAFLHVLRVFYGWQAVLGGYVLPMWISWLAVLMAGFLSYQGFMLGKK